MGIFDRYINKKKQEDGRPGGAPKTEGADIAPPVMTQPKMTQEEKDEYAKFHPGQVYKSGDIGKYRMREDNLAVNEGRENHPEMKINDVSDLSKEEQPETYIDKEIREKEEQKATEELRNKIEQSLSK